MKKAQSKIRLGLIGTGNIGRIHLTSICSLNYAKLVDTDIAALCDTDQASLRSAGELFESKAIYTDYSNLIDDPNVDVVYVCTPTSTHAEMVKGATKAKKAIFCEKPLAHNSIQVRDLFALTKAAGVPAGVGLVLRYDPFILYAKKLIEQHDFGRPMLAHIRDDQRFPVDYAYYSKWRGDKSIAGGGTLIEHSIHDVDLLRWLFGDIENVFARINHYSRREVEDHASLVMTHRNGTISTLDSVWHWVDRLNERTIELFFDGAYIGINLESGKRFLDYQSREEGPIHIGADTANEALYEALGLDSAKLSSEAKDALVSVGAERYTALDYSFLKSVEYGTEQSPNFKDALQAHEIIDAAYESSNTGKSVSLM